MSESVAILGAGIGGLAAAYRLAGAGYKPVVFESGPRAGGLGAAIDHHGVAIDRFYHVLLDSDAELLALIDAVGLRDQLVWSDTGMGFHLGGELYGMNSPLDLLRFGALPFIDRLRTGLGALRATRLQRHPLRLDDVPAREWLLQLFGTRVTEKIWQPLLRAKFGDAAESIPAYWLWSLLSREKNGGKEIKGYLLGGFQRLADKLCAAIEERGGEIRFQHPVERLEQHGARFRLFVGGAPADFDVLVSTLPMAALQRVASPALAAELPLPDLRYQGVVNAIVVSRQRLERFYWTVVVDPRFAFQGVVETTHVIPPESLGGRHLVYLMNYCDAASPTYNRPDDQIRSEALDGLERLYPRFDRSAVETVYVFRAPHVEPVWSLGYLHKRPPHEIGTSNLFLSTTAQAYPRVTAWNTSIGLARETVDAILARPEIRKTHTAPGPVALPSAAFAELGSTVFSSVAHGR